MAAHVPRLLVDAPLSVGSEFALPANKAHHLKNVLRLKAGASLRLFNGDGREYAATITRADRNDVRVAIERSYTPERESPLTLTLAQGIARGERMDFAVAKAVELGVSAIQPLFTARGQVKLGGARLEKKQAHWQRVAESAAEQSGRLAWPRVAPALALVDYLRTARAGLRLILAPNAESGLGALARTDNVTILIGPESGLSNAEIETATAAGYTPLRLGPRVLRTETAGMAALAAIQSLWGDLG